MTLGKSPERRSTHLACTFALFFLLPAMRQDTKGGAVPPQGYHLKKKKSHMLGVPTNRAWIPSGAVQTIVCFAMYLLVCEELYPLYSYLYTGSSVICSQTHFYLEQCLTSIKCNFLYYQSNTTPYTELLNLSMTHPTTQWTLKIRQRCWENERFWDLSLDWKSMRARTPSIWFTVVHQGLWQCA